MMCLSYINCFGALLGCWLAPLSLSEAMSWFFNQYEFVRLEQGPFNLAITLLQECPSYLIYSYSLSIILFLFLVNNFY